jgi:aspartate aminotransferase
MELDYLNVGGQRWEALAQSDSIIHMGHNCNQLELDPSIHLAMTSAIEADEYRNYTPPYGFEELQALMKADVGVDGVNVMVTQGATEAIFQAMSTILHSGDQAIVSDPGWPQIPTFARQLGAEVIEIPIYEGAARGKMTADVIRPYMTARTKLITLIDPLNPLGTCYSEAEIKAICRLVEDHDAYLLHDATYRDFAIDGHFPAVRYSERAFMNISLSKVCGFAGMRVGATLANQKLLNQIYERQISRLGGNWIAQRGAIAAYKSKPIWCPHVLDVNRRNQRVLKETLDHVEGMRVITYPSSGNFLSVDVAGTGRTSEQVVKAVLDSGFIIRSGGYTSPRYGDQFVRITTTVPPEHVDLFCKAIPSTISGKRLK